MILGHGSNIMGMLSGVVVVYIMLSTTADILSRSLLGRAIPGVIETNAALLTLLVYLAIAYTQRINGHVSLELAVRKLPSGVANALYRVGMAIVLIVAIWMVWAVGINAWKAYEVGQRTYGSVSFALWPFRAVIFLGLLTFSAELLRSLLIGLDFADEEEIDRLEQLEKEGV